MSPILQRAIRYSLYSGYFACCLILFGLFNLPYEEAESFLSRYTRTHLNAELEINSTSISPTGRVSIDRGTLTFMPTIGEAKRIADAQRDLEVWNVEQARVKAEKIAEKAILENEEAEAKRPANKGAEADALDGGDNDDDDDDDDDNDDESEADLDNEVKPQSKRKTPADLRKMESAVASVKPVVPSPPLPIRFESLVASTAPIKLIKDLEDGQLFNERNHVSFEGIINGSKFSFSLERELNNTLVSASIDGLELGLLSILTRLTDFPVSGSLSVDIDLNIPVTDGGYDFRETEGVISFLLQDKAKLGPATFQTKMGNVEFIPITFDRLELDLRVAKRRVSINEFRMTGKDLELCGTGYVSLTNGRASPRPKRSRRSKKKSGKVPTVQKLTRQQRSTSDILSGMMQASRSNLFVRFKFKDQYLEKKDNSLLRLLVNSRSMKKGMDDAGFIGHKTTATLKSLVGPLSWVASKNSPHKSAVNQCGNDRDSSSKAKPAKPKARKQGNPQKTKSRASSKALNRGRGAKPFNAKRGGSPFNTTRTSSGSRKTPTPKNAPSGKGSRPEESADADDDDESDESNQGSDTNDDRETAPSIDGGEEDEGESEVTVDGEQQNGREAEEQEDNE
jgi:type II secretion system protein N